MYVYKSIGFGLKKSSIETEPKYFDFLKFKPKPNRTEKLNSVRSVSIGFFDSSVFCTPLPVVARQVGVERLDIPRGKA